MEKDFRLHVPQAVALVNQALFDKSLDLPERYAQLCASCGIPFTAMVHIIAGGKADGLIKMVDEENFRTRVREISGGKYTMKSKGHAKIIKDIFTHCPPHFTGFNSHFLRTGENLSGLWVSKEEIELLRHFSITNYSGFARLLNNSFDSESGQKVIVVGGRNVNLVIALPSVLEKTNLAAITKKRVRFEEIQNYWSQQSRREQQLGKTVYPQFLTCYPKGASFKRIGPD